VVFKAFMFSQLGFVTCWQKEIGLNAASKISVKLCTVPNLIKALGAYLGA